MGPLLEDYRVLELLYASSRSVVVRAQRASDAISVVLKQPAPGLPDNVARARFRHEVAMRAGLDARWVVQILEHNDLRLVLEDVGGCSLQQFLGLARVEMGPALELACSLTQALSSVHQAGVLHGDVHPGNFIYEESTGCLKISDFDLALRLESAGQVADSMIQGSLAYLSPERTGRLNAAIGFPSDLYSLGVTLYQLFSGRLPFESDDPLRLVHSHLALEPDPIHTIPSALSRIVQRLLRKDPGKRYQTANGLLHDLRHCQRELREDGTISSFKLGANDRPAHFKVPDQLYGRDLQVEQLRAALTGDCQVVLVAGPSGVGKSSLVRHAAASTRSRFLSGKFDQLRSEIPCSALMEALEQLADQLLTENEERLRDWKERLSERLDSRLGLVLEHVPALERLVGPQLPSPPVEASAAQGRFLATFQELLQLFARDQEPLLLFLDDLQWADSLTVHLLTQLAASPESRGLKMVLAYRDQELSAGQPFKRALSQFQKVLEIRLDPLEVSEVQQLLNDCLRCPAAELTELSQIITQKTEGNPFFVRQFLQTLHHDGHLRYSHSQGSFVCDLEQVRAASITDNVAQLLAHNLERLPAGTLRLLQVAAAVGNRFSLSTLKSISDQDLETDLKPALELGLILAVAGWEPTYRFQHDRVQRAAYEFLDTTHLPGLHAEIGRKLLARLGPEQLEERLLEVVGHLNRAESSTEDRAEWAQLNRRAGDKARMAAAYDLACTCYRAAANLQGWRDNPELLYEVHYQLAECLRLSACLAEALEVLQQASAQVQDPRQLGELECLRMNLYDSQGDLETARHCIRRAAAWLGEELPQEPGAAIQAEVDAILDWTRQGEIERLLELPNLEDPRLATFMEVLNAATPIAFQSEPPLGILITLRQVSLSLKNGNSVYAPRAYCGLYRILEWFGEPEIGYRFARLGHQLNLLRQEKAPRSSIDFVHGYFIEPWNQPWTEVLRAFRRSWQSGLESGDYAHMGYSAIYEVFAALLGGMPLPQLFAQTELTMRTCRQLGEANKASFLSSLLSLVQQLMGRQVWQPIVPELAPTGMMLSYTQHCVDLIHAYHSEDEPAALKVLEAMKPLLPSYKGYLTETFLYLYGGLVAASRGDLEELEQARDWMAGQSCRANFGAPHCLLQAELHRLRGEGMEAADQYDQAIELAGNYGLLGLEALANERAGEFWIGRGKAHFAGYYLRASHRLFRHWGAGSLAGRMELRYSALLSNRSVDASSSTNQAADVIDYASLARAAQAISGEIVLERLLGTLTQLLIENAGAQTGALILEREGDWEIRATRRLESAPVEVVSDLPLSRADVARGVVQYALRTGQKVVIGDARLHATFGQDEYVRNRAPRSIFCAPIRHKGRLLGALYLENNLLVEAFDERRLSGLEILLAQVGVSLENARLFARERRQAEELEELVEHRTLELRQANELLREESNSRERMENELRLGQKLQAVGQLAAGVAHEINTPMQYIQDNLSFVRDVSARWQDLDEDSAEVPEALDAALEGVRRVTAIVRAMKAFSYPDQSERALVDLNLAIENTLLVARNEYKLVADVVTDFGSLPPYLCFAGELNQVVLNLVVNAAHAIEETGRRGMIRVTTRREESALVVDISDDGNGIPHDVQSRIFDPFFTTKDVGRGTGQGLAIARSAVERQGGTLSFVTRAGEGTTFSVRLPTR